MEEAIRKLLRGYNSFRNSYFSGHTRLFQKLRKGQHPKVLVIACSDSRVDPALITGCDPGDMFVIRNVANLIPPYECDDLGLHHGTSAALEYAVRALEVEHIIILGHSDCGGIKTLMARSGKGVGGEFIGPWLDLAEPARREVEQNLAGADRSTCLRACEEISVMMSLRNLLTFPWIKERVEANHLQLHGWYFHVGTGGLYEFDHEDGTFHPFADPNAS